jgi:hypothetical protein
MLAACAPRAVPVPTPVVQRWQVDVSGAPLPYQLRLPIGRVQGVVVLIGTPSEAYLPTLLGRAGIATVQPELAEDSLYLDARSMRGLELVALDAVARTEAPPGRIAVGGISLGGTAAVAFVEFCAAGRCPPSVVPAAVFSVDAPLDMERLWRAAVGRLRWDTTGVGTAEAHWVVDHLVHVMGGTPDDRPAEYAARSPFRYEEPNGGNARFLLGTPLRLYAEPDMDFWLSRGLDYYQINAFDAAGITNRLRHLGHADVELILTSGRGVRPNGVRNPHSWSIVDEPDLARWLTARLEAQ